MHLNRHAGVALIEVLVTSVIIAIGLSGTAALILKSTQSTNDSAQRSVGLWVVQDFVGRIRSNRKGAHDSQYVINGAQNCGKTPKPICSDIYLSENKVDAANCDAAQMAAFDSWISVCGVSSTTTDNASEMLKDPMLQSTCVYRQSRGGDGEVNCLKYEVTLKWKAQVKQSDGSMMTTQMSHSQVVEIN